MKNSHFVAEYEFKASRKVLYPYLNTASGLSLWFADDANVDDDKLFVFNWDDEKHKARLAVQRQNHLVKFEFLDNANDTETTSEGTDDKPFIELCLDENDMTGIVYLKVIDTATTDNEEEFQEIWKQLTDTLREIVGG